MEEKIMGKYEKLAKEILENVGGKKTSTPSHTVLQD